LFSKYKSLELDIKNYTALPSLLRQELNDHQFSLLSIELVRLFYSNDKQTVKALFRTYSGDLFESVLMRYEDGRNSACVSSMIGCPLNCSFCATGKMGFTANLDEFEISDQVIFWANFLKKEKEKITNVVYMGMGEPLLNLDNVLNSIKIITDKNYFGLGQKHITVSTAGIVKRIDQLTLSDFNGNLAISLHSPFQKIREEIMPIAKLNKLSDLMDSVYRFEESKKTRITLEYILINGINMNESDANKLADITKGHNFLVNLIPYNKVAGCDYKRPSNNQVFKFYRLLKSLKINVTLRLGMGYDNNSSCGQLTTINYDKFKKISTTES